MINFKEQIANAISNVTNIDNNELIKYIEIPAVAEMGDYAFPCFRLAKILKKSPQAIADEIKDKISIDKEIIDKIEVVNGYINFYINNETLTKNVLEEIQTKKENYGSSDKGKDEVILIEYSSPNIAKTFHIGHLRTTLIGRALYNVYKYLGYNTIGINHLGDYGTQFGKMIEGYKLWGEEYNIEENPIEELTKIYVRINALCKENEEVLERCRDNFKKLEDGDRYCMELWQKINDVSLKEFYKIYKILNIEFDEILGESYYQYSNLTKQVVDILDKTGKLVESEGAKIIDLSDKNMPPCIIWKTNGSSTYATRDLAAILNRARKYAFDKCIYVVAYEQNLYFKQLFEVAKLLGINEKSQQGLEHVSYGMVRLKEGKMSTREGNVIKVEDLLNESIERAEKIIEEKSPDLDNKEDVAKKVGIGAVIFNDLYSSRIKDEVFDWDTVLNFQGETGPYIQYMYVRTKSILDNANFSCEQNIDITKLQDIEAINVLKTLYKFNDTLVSVIDKNEPSFLSRYLIELSQKYSAFYNEHKILDEDIEIRNARLALTYAVSTVLKTGAQLLGIEMPERM